MNIRWIGFVGVVILLIAGGVFFFSKKREFPYRFMEAPGENISTSSVQSAQQIFPENDRDGDGIPAEKEAELKTSDTEFDSDFDGLTDTSEIATWKTNPASPDTDGDGFFDGVEVLNGFNPLGEGKAL